MRPLAPDRARARLAHAAARARALAAQEATATIRHALRNKLAAIRNANFYLKRRVGSANEDPRVAEFFALVDSEVKGACEMLEATRQEQLPESSEPPATDPSAVLRELASALPVADGVRVDVSAVEEGPPVAADEDDLAVALLLLLENAADAVTTSGGTVRLALERAGGRVRFLVADDGPGFTAEAREKAFQRFSTKPGRLGAGLPVARRIASRWDGRVEIGEPASGALVVLDLPAAAARGGGP